MTSTLPRFILGSRSPRRLELLRLLVPAERIVVVTPRSADELGFEGLHDDASIERRLREITSAKCDDVLEQILSCDRSADVAARPSASVVIAADTTIIAAENDGRLIVLGQPPSSADWPETVRRWFRTCYFGRTHTAATAVVVATCDGRRLTRVVRTQVTFSADGERWLDWYVETGEPVGKAGGYAIQGAGSVFVERIEGSLSNVVGLPHRETAEMLAECGLWP